MNHQGTERCVLVTGASSGIGEAIVTALLEQGFIVYAGARRVERMSHLADKGARVLSLDITDADSIAAVLTRIERDGVELDGLVNNAGYGSYGVLEEVSIEEARRQFEVKKFCFFGDRIRKFIRRFFAFSAQCGRSEWKRDRQTRNNGIAIAEAANFFVIQIKDRLTWQDQTIGHRNADRHRLILQRLSRRFRSGLHHAVHRIRQLARICGVKARLTKRFAIGRIEEDQIARFAGAGAQSRRVMAYQRGL